VLSRGEVSPPLICWQHYSPCSPGYHPLSWFTRTPWSISAKLLPRTVGSQNILEHGVFFYICRILHFPLLNMRFQSAHVYSLSRCLWMAAQPSGISATPPCCVSSANFLWIHSDPSSRSLMKTLNRIGPNIDPWGTQLVTGLQLGCIPLITTLWAWLFSHFSIHFAACSFSPYLLSFSL